MIGDDPELAVALRERLDRTFVTVREVRAGEADAAVRDCRPWPWMVIGGGVGSADCVGRLLAGLPTLVLWRDEPPRGLPAHTQVIQLFSELAAAAEAAISAEVCGIRLAPGAGVTMPDGEHAASPALEALVPSDGRPLFAATRHFSGVAATLAAHGVPMRVARTAAGGVVLEPRTA